MADNRTATGEPGRDEQGRFRPGQSGNPRGRPRGTGGAGAEWERVLAHLRKRVLGRRVTCRTEAEKELAKLSLLELATLATRLRKLEVGS